MKALLLAGGFGTRMRPLTLTRPKHLLPIVNRPHIQHVFDLLQRHGILDVVLTTSYLAEAFEATRLEAAQRGLRLEVAHEDEAKGTAGAIKNAEALLGDDAFLVFNADVLTGVDLAALIAFHRDTGGETTIYLTPVDDPSAFGVVPTDRRGRVVSFIEKPPPGEAPTDLINAGVYVMEPAALKRIPEGIEWSAERSLFPAMVKEGLLFAVALPGYWMDVGTPDKYVQANVDALRGTFATDAVADPGPDANVLAPDAVVAEGAEVSSSSIGAGCVVEAKAVVRDSVLLDGVRVAAGATVRHSVLGEGSTIAPGAVVEFAAVADGGSAGH